MTDYLGYGLRYVRKLWGGAMPEGEDILARGAAILAGGLFGYVLDSDWKVKASVGVLVLVALDTVLGVILASRTPKTLNSSGFGRVMTKITVYGAYLVAAAVVERFVLAGVVPLVMMILFLMILTEALSIFENGRALEIKGFIVIEKFLKSIIRRTVQEVGKAAEEQSTSKTTKEE